MKQMRSASVIRKEGMECLIESLGVVEAEVFISSLLRDSFDYTEWQRDYFSGIQRTPNNICVKRRIS
jgi:hypothetical protein